jgi:hypothetical protein
MLASAIERLMGDLKEGAKHEFFFHYPNATTPLIHPAFDGFEVNDSWKPITDEFPSTIREIQSGLDCYAFGDYPGCIFHMTRIAELGLREIARQLKKAVKKESLSNTRCGEKLLAHCEAPLTVWLMRKGTSLP